MTKEIFKYKLNVIPFTKSPDLYF